MHFSLDDSAGMLAAAGMQMSKCETFQKCSSFSLGCNHMEGDIDVYFLRNEYEYFLWSKEYCTLLCIFSALVWLLSL